MSPRTSASSSPSPSYRQVMVFVDGGYLRKHLKSKWKNDEFSTGVFLQLVRELVEKVHHGLILGELIRIYYYDAVVGEEEPTKRNRQQKFFDKLRELPFCEVRLGRLVEENKRKENKKKRYKKKRYKQKGVDILMAIDMLDKAYEKHYEIAVLVTGDGDLVSLVEAVKNTGARVYGACIEKHVPKTLLASFDNYTMISEKTLEDLAKNKLRVGKDNKSTIGER